ncbi:MAG: glutathione S-transferase C-terminal domain-containing protein [Myxococcota bacterium]
MAEEDVSIEESQRDAERRRASGEFVRGRSGFRGVLGEDTPPEPGRYHLYVALNCPWCHRVMLARNVLGLARSVSVDVAFPNRTEEGLWEFNPDRIATLTGATLPECTLETASGHGFRMAKQLYEAEGSEEKSLPILFDKQRQRIVSNESAEIVRMLNATAAALGADNPPDLYPAELRSEIDTLNESIYVRINNGAYKAGFSSDQGVYAAAFDAYFSELEALEARLGTGPRPYLTGDTFTEADLRLFPTLYRHDPVYMIRMKLNGARILDYPNLWRWLCRVHALPGIAESGSLVHCRQGYFGRSGNNVVPRGPIKPMPYPEAYHHPELAGV